MPVVCNACGNRAYKPIVCAWCKVVVCASCMSLDRNQARQNWCGECDDDYEDEGDDDG